MNINTFKRNVACWSFLRFLRNACIGILCTVEKKGAKRRFNLKGDIQKKVFPRVFKINVGESAKKSLEVLR